MMFSPLFLLSALPLLTAALPSALSLINIPKGPFYLTELDVIVGVTTGYLGPSNVGSVIGMAIAFSDNITSTAGNAIVSQSYTTGTRPPTTFGGADIRDSNFRVNITGYTAANDFTLSMIHLVQDKDTQKVMKAAKIEITPDSDFITGNGTRISLKAPMSVDLTELSLY